MIIFEEKDRQAWLGFLNTEVAQKGLALLRESKRPSIRSTGDPHEMQFDCGSQAGFDHAIEEVEKLARMPEDKDLKTADIPQLHQLRRG